MHSEIKFHQYNSYHQIQVNCTNFFKWNLTSNVFCLEMLKAKLKQFGSHNKYSLNNLKSQEICFGLNFLFLLFENNPNKTLRVMFHQDNFQLTIQCYPMDQHFFSINCQKFLFWLFSFLILHMENITLQQIPGALDHFNLLFHYEGLNSVPKF